MRNKTHRKQGISTITSAINNTFAWGTWLAQHRKRNGGSGKRIGDPKPVVVAPRLDKNGKQSQSSCQNSKVFDDWWPSSEEYNLLIADLHYDRNGECHRLVLTRKQRRARNSALKEANRLPKSLHHCVNCCPFCLSEEVPLSVRQELCHKLRGYGIGGLRVCNNGPRKAHYAN